MNKTVWNDAEEIIKNTLLDNLPKKSVEMALKDYDFSKNTYLVAIGKAAWQMAKVATDYLGPKIKQGIVITKYQHSQGELPNIEIIEAGHPISDKNTLVGTKKVLDLTKSLNENDQLLFLVSGGGSALFELPLKGISLEDIIDINDQLLASGADIVEINMIRKRLSTVKAGRFAHHLDPANIYAVILSDVLGDRLDSIASGPAAPDLSTTEDALSIVKKYNINLEERILDYLKIETPKKLSNVDTIITGSVRTLCDSAAKHAKALGYTPHILTSTLNCEAKEAGRMMATMAEEVDKSENSFSRPCAIILGGETVVRLLGKGKGGRNQELALSAAEGISGMFDTVIFSLGSDGTDGPTDAAGGIVDGSTYNNLIERKINPHQVLLNNDSYHALKAVDGLLITGPTGTNVNDVSVLLLR